MRNLFIIFFILFLCSSAAISKEIGCIVSSSTWCHFNQECDGITKETDSIFEIHPEKNIMYWVDKESNVETIKIQYIPHDTTDIYRFADGIGYLIINKNSRAFIEVSSTDSFATVHRYGTCYTKD